MEDQLIPIVFVAAMAPPKSGPHVCAGRAVDDPASTRYLDRLDHARTETTRKAALIHKLRRIISPLDPSGRTHAEVTARSLHTVGGIPSQLPNSAFNTPLYTLVLPFQSLSVRPFQALPFATS